MGWFSTNKYSQKQKYITRKQIERLSSWVGKSNVSQSDSQAIYQAVLKRRGSDGHMSLYQVYDALTKLKNQGKITKYDRKAIMKRFEEFY